MSAADPAPHDPDTQTGQPTPDPLDIPMLTDVVRVSRYAARDRLTYSLFYQMAKITIERGSLVHDDRLDALEGSVRYWQDKLAIDQQESVKRQREKDYLTMMADPLMKRRNDPPKRGSLFNKYAR